MTRRTTKRARPQAVGKKLKREHSEAAGAVNPPQKALSAEVPSAEKLPLAPIAAAAGSPPDLPPCNCRYDFNPQRQLYFCAHPQVHASNHLVSPAVCRLCTRWQQPTPQQLRPFPTKLHVRRDGPCLYLGRQSGLRECPTCRGKVRLKVFECQHPGHQETTHRDCQQCLDYEPQLKVGTIVEWSLGITTSPRRAATLDRCLASLVRAGWSSGRIFAEPGSPIPPAAPFAVTWRESKLGAWPNWYLALAELYMRQPFADAYLLIQDDAVFCRNLRAMLEQSLWPRVKVGLVSPYCPEVYRQDEPGFHEVSGRGGLAGAVTCILPNVAARSLLTHPPAVEHRLRGSPVGERGIDDVLGEWAASCSLPVFYHTPSLVDHVGDTSTIWNRDGAARGRLRRPAGFVGEEFNALQALNSERKTRS